MRDVASTEIVVVDFRIASPVFTRSAPLNVKTQSTALFCSVIESNVCSPPYRQALFRAAVAFTLQDLSTATPPSGQAIGPATPPSMRSGAAVAARGTRRIASQSSVTTNAR